MGSDIRPLYYWGKPTAEQRDMLREAKEMMAVPWFVKPTRATEKTAGNVLAFEPVPFFISGGIALLRPPYTSTRMLAALKEVMGVEEPKHLYYQEWPGAKNVKEILGGVQVAEVEWEE